MPYALFNIVCLAGLVMAARQGFFAALYHNDPTFIGFATIAIFTATWIYSGLAWRWPWKYLVSADAAFAESGHKPPTRRSIDRIYRAATLMVTVGFLGTLIGFALALSDVSADALTDVDSVSRMIATMMEGVGAIVWTSICGFVFGTWTLVNYWLLGGEL